MGSIVPASRYTSGQALFNLEMAYALPELAWQDVRVRRVQQHGADSATYEVRVQWKNNGRLPTALKQAQLVKIVQEDRLVLTFPRDSAGDARAAAHGRRQQGSHGQRRRHGVFRRKSVHRRRRRAPRAGAAERTVV